jgi:hypothetical protein
MESHTQGYDDCLNQDSDDEGEDMCERFAMNVAMGSNGETVMINGSAVCGHCKKAGHKRSECFQLMKCSHCGKVGHPVRYCNQKHGDAFQMMEEWLKSNPTGPPPEQLTQFFQ